MLRPTKSDLDTDEVDPLIFSKNTAVTGTRRRLTSRSPVERTARLVGASTVAYPGASHVNIRMKGNEQHQSMQDHTPTNSETLNRLNILRNNVDSSGMSSFRSIPGLSESFVADTDYYRTYYSNKDTSSELMDRRLNADRSGKFCAIFSLIGMLFLVFIGVLIESQPIYVKGIKGSRPTRIRKLKTWGDIRRKNYRLFNIIGDDDDPLIQEGYLPASWRRLTRLLRTDDFSYENNSSKNGNQGVATETVYIMRRESKNAFKAAAAYFLLMVLSVIYINNQDNMVSFNLFQWFIYVRHHMLLAYQKYLRGGYVDIPDSLSVAPILPVFVDDIADFDNKNQGERRDLVRKAHSLSSLELRSRRSGTSSMRVSRSKDKEK